MFPTPASILTRYTESQTVYLKVALSCMDMSAADATAMRRGLHHPRAQYTKAIMKVC